MSENIYLFITMKMDMILTQKNNFIQKLDSLKKLLSNLFAGIFLVIYVENL